MPRWIPLLIIATTLLGAGPAAAEDPPPDRPTVGLCLAGGGARGGAHIGVLHVLEELRVPVDYIAGTSIGSIIGGLYASGFSPADMDSAVLSIDWVKLFKDSPPRRTANFRRKEEDRLPYFDFEFGIGRHGFKAPAGFISGQKLTFLLHELTLHTATIDHFDDLPIPFRAVSTDLLDGSVVVTDRGSLTDAMRASMAIPGAFTPHVIDGRPLIDGGIVRNIPYDVVKAMGADIVIVVDVGTPPGELDTDPSLMSVLQQTIAVGIYNNAGISLTEMTDQDLLLIPGLDGIRTESFEFMADASVRGEVVAREHSDRLRQLSLSEADYAAWHSSQRRSEEPVSIMIDRVRMASPSRVDAGRIDRQVKSAPDQLLDIEVLDKDINRLYRLGEFEMVDFALEPSTAPPAHDLVIRTRDKRWGPNYLRLGMILEGHLDGRAEFAFLMYHRMATINRLGAEWRNQASLGNRLGVTSEFYQPLLVSGRLFVAPRVDTYLSKRQRYFNFDVSEQVSSSAVTGHLDVGLNMSHWGELRLGAYRGQYWGDVSNLPEYESLDDRLGGLSGRLAMDQLDDLDFPRHGWGLTVAARLARSELGATTEYDRLSARVAGAATTGRLTFNVRAEAGTAFGDALPFHDRFELGGFGRLSGLQRGRVFGDDMGYATIGAFYRIARLTPPLGHNVYVGLAAEAGQAWATADEPALADILTGGTAYLGAETLLGPVYVGYGWTEGKHTSVYVIFGQIH